MQSGVAAVIVTYNRKELLVLCIQGILSQTIKPQKIFIIDNNSTDGTESHLLQTGLANNQSIIYIKLDKNTGGAGGFNVGCDLASQEGFEWLWLMDDDVVPTDSALENQLKYRNISHCIHPRKVFEDGTSFLWEQIFCPQTGKPFNLYDISFEKEKEWCPVNVGCFEGMLINKSLIQKIGLPDPRFFICDDDTMYGFLASLYTNNIYVRDAVFIKKIKPSSQISEIKTYFFVRNYFLKLEYLKRLKLNNSLLSFFFHLISIGKLLTSALRQRKFLRITRAIFYSYKDAIGGHFGPGTYKIKT